jgi:Domain of unknown function (DUF3806)
MVARQGALRDEGASIVVFPVTMISKRLERGETVDVRALFDAACQDISR